VKIVLGLFAALVIATPAQAQLKPEIQTGSMIPVKPQPLDEKRAGDVRKHFAQCVYRSATPKVLTMLDHSDPAWIDLKAAGIKDVNTELGMSRCLGMQVGVDQLALSLKFSPVVLRDLMAEEVYLARNPAAPSLAADAAAIVPFVIPSDTQPATAAALTEFTDCAVRVDPAGADALLRTMPGSDREHDAAAALAPALGQCLRTGQKVNLKPGGIRALIAYAMWSRFVRTPAVK
jgi:hypothetical protein